MLRAFSYVLKTLAIIALVMFTDSARGSMLDLTQQGSTGVVNNAVFMQFDPASSTGSGSMDSFLRIQGSGVEKGYNTGGKTEFETKSGQFTHSLQLSAVPTLNFSGITYREFILDTNEVSGSTSFISLDSLEIRLADSGNLTGYDNSFGQLIYSLDDSVDNWILLDASLSSGSGSGDMTLLVPNNLFGTDDAKYIYLYSEFGQNVASDDGFEEWAVGVGGAVNPEPATLSMLVLGGLGLIRRKRV